MLRKTNTILSILLLTILLAGISGCYIDTNESDREPPAIPRGVQTITGDEQVVIEWYPNGEFDLAGYKVWRGRDDVNFNDLLADVSESTTHYIDTDVRNGETYYYAVSAYDAEGNESELSPENAWDTPRPEGRNITLDDYLLFPEEAGSISHSHTKEVSLGTHWRRISISGLIRKLALPTSIQTMKPLCKI